MDAGSSGRSGGPGGPTVGEGGEGLGSVSASLGEELAQLDRELDEIGLLARQAATEAERHEGRRAKAEERVTALERDPIAGPEEVRDARIQLLTLSRRAMLFSAQQDVLEGKQKTLQRYRDRLSWVIQSLGGLDPRSVPIYRPAGTGTSSAEATGTARQLRPNESADVLRAQEDIRRDIARQMHDGPVQSLANIALQSEIVERLVGRGDSRATAELATLRRMVQATLAQTKDFVFDVRPMVLDDLGLVPTLRRTAIDRGQRSGIEIDFDSSGTDRRLAADLEIGLFRILDDAIAGYVALRPIRVTARLDWGDHELSAIVRSMWAAVEERATATNPGDERRSELPPALAAMIEQKDREERRTRAVARSLPEDRLEEIRDRAGALGASMSVLDGGQGLEVIAGLH